MEDETNLTKEKNVAGIYIRVSTDDQARERLFFRRTTRKIRGAL